jgi:hypothetical protein
MTLMNVTFRYRMLPGEHRMSALVRELYGVPNISFDDTDRRVNVEYDTSLMTEDDIAALLRGAGLDIDPERLPKKLIHGKSEFPAKSST